MTITTRTTAPPPDDMTLPRGKRRRRHSMSCALAPRGKLLTVGCDHPCGANHPHIRRTRPRTPLLDESNTTARTSPSQDPGWFTARARPITADHPTLSAFKEHYSNTETEPDNTSTPVLTAVERTAQLLLLLGWPTEVAQDGEKQICDTLIQHGAPHSIEALPQDKQPRHPNPSWTVLLWTMLGKHQPMYATDDQDKRLATQTLTTGISEEE